MSKKSDFFKKYNLEKRQIEGYEELIPWLGETAENREFVNSLWLHGSRCVSQHEKYSDLDVAFIVEREEDKDKLKGELKKNLYYKKFYDYFYDKTFEYWEFNNKEVGIHIYGNWEFSQMVKSFFRDVAYFEENQGFIQHIFIESKALYDPKNKFTQARATLSEYPQSLRRAVVEITLKRIRQEAEWWNMRKYWKSVFEEMIILKSFIDEVAKCHYALNNRYRKKFLKQYPIDMKKLKPNLEKELGVLIHVDPMNSEDRAKVSVMNGIFKKLNNYYKKIYDLNEDIKI